MRAPLARHALFLKGPRQGRAFLVLAAVLVVCLAMILAGCGKSQPAPRSKPRASEPTTRTPPKGTFKPYTIRGKTYYPMQTAHGFVEEGVASWYGKDFHGKKTASGEVYDMYGMTAAHKLLPMHTQVRVTNLENGKVLELRVNDRGPFVHGRIIDLSFTAARRLGMAEQGTARVRVESLSIPGQPTVASKSGARGASPAKAFVLPGPFYVQVGAFSVRDNAYRLASELKAQGYKSTRVQEALIRGKSFWRVQAGEFAQLDAAHMALERLSARFASAFVVAR
jgi:rare lipoprotein A